MREQIQSLSADEMRAVIGGIGIIEQIMEAVTHKHDDPSRNIRQAFQTRESG